MTPQSPAPTPTPITPAPEPRKTPVAHVDTLRGSIKFAIPITSTDMASLESANKLLSAAVKVLKDGKAYAEADASLGRTRGDVLP